MSREAPARDNAAGGGEGLTLDWGGSGSVSRAGDNKRRVPSSACGTSDGLLESMKHGLVLSGYGVPLPAPRGGKSLQRETLGINYGSGRYDCDGAGL